VDFKAPPVYQVAPVSEKGIQVVRAYRKHEGKESQFLQKLFSKDDYINNGRGRLPPILARLLIEEGNNPVLLDTMPLAEALNNSCGKFEYLRSSTS
jgi:hypothetical protein